MAKPARAACDRCENRIPAGEPFCGSCGYPSVWANHDERTAWEVAQYRHKSEQAPIGLPYERPKPTVVLDPPRSARRGLFSRRAHSPSPLRTEQTPVLKPVPAPDVAPAAVIEPSRVEAPRIESRRVEAVAQKRTLKPSAMDDRPATDAPATIVAVRMLNARVAELDAKVQELQREVDRLRGEPGRRFGA
jgi:hypothetical protein